MLVWFAKCQGLFIVQQQHTLTLCNDAAHLHTAAAATAARVVVNSAQQAQHNKLSAKSSVSQAQFVGSVLSVDDEPCNSSKSICLLAIGL
jgi:hypothetical protein